MIGHRANDVEHLADVTNASCQILHLAGGSRYAGDQFADGIDCTQNLLSTELSGLIRFAYGIGSRDGIACNIFGGTGHFIDGRRSRSPFARKLFANKGAVLGAAVLLLFVLAAVFAPWIAPFDPVKPNFLAVRKAPSLIYWLGTDELGRDLRASRLWQA